MTNEAAYDSIGIGYSGVRWPDQRIAARIESALEGAESVITVGAGTGSYEPRGARHVAVEPSEEMIRQRPKDAPVCVKGTAESLPFIDGQFDAALAVLTLHHWQDKAAGLREMQRVAKRVVLFTIDPGPMDEFWLTRDYIPEFIEQDRVRFPAMEWYASVLGEVRIEEVPIPWDCTDGFLGAYWRRPEMYLDEKVRAGISSFQQADPAVVQRGLKALKADQDSGEWRRRNAGVAGLIELELGYKLIIAR